MMSSFIISLTMFCAISCTGLALKCLECFQKNSDTCEGVSVECSNSTECLVVSEFYHADNTTYYSIRKGFNPGVPCNTTEYISNFANREVRINVQCCTGDNCNTNDYYMPPEQIQHNGRLCTSCYGDELNECFSDHTIKCLNEEDKCVHFIGRFKDPGNNIQEHNIKGCMSSLACALKFEGIVGIEEIKTNTFDCSD